MIKKKIKKVVVEHMGLKLTKPDAKTHAKIVKAAAKADRERTWIPDEKVRPERYRHG